MYYIYLCYKSPPFDGLRQFEGIPDSLNGNGRQKPRSTGGIMALRHHRFVRIPQSGRNHEPWDADRE